MKQCIKKKSKNIIKTVACILIIIFIFQFFPTIVLGIQNIKEENIQNVTSVLEQQEKEETEEIKEIVGELKEKRTLNQKHFLQSDGNIIATVYPYNVHYEENGKLIDIDNSLNETNDENGEYENNKNSFEVKFAKKSNKNNLVKLKIKNNNIKWALQNSNKVKATILKSDDNNDKNKKLKIKNISSGVIQYENILNGIDLQYNVISDSIKENIILKSKEAISQQIVFEFNTSNLKMEKNKDGNIVFYKENKNDILFLLEAPFMYDAKNEISTDIGVDLKGKNGKYTLTLKPDKKWLEDSTREYPIIIDPTVETSLNYENIQDTYIFNGDTGYPNRYAAHILRVGSNNTLASRNPIRSLIKFGLPELNAGDQVIKAVLDICSYPDTNEWNPPSETIQIDVHKMTQDWNTSNASWTNLSNKYDSRISDYVKYHYDSNNPAKFYYFDITSIVKDWYVTGNNYGLVLKDHTEIYNAPHSDAYFFSADVNRAYINARPMIQIIYRNQTGLESYQTYHTQAIGRAGTIYTNDYNGNLTLLHDDVSTPGSRLPVKVNHVYNTNDKDTNIGYGKGFRLNLSQIITKETINGAEYIKYVDEDGTSHYFKKEGNNYIDEDNLGLTLTQDGSEYYYLEDKEKNKLAFVRKMLGSTYIWHLEKIEDAYQNTITLHLISDNVLGARISSVTDAAGNNINMSYNSDNKLSKITDVSGKVTIYSYNSNGNLTNIKYSDNKNSAYSYASNSLLSQVKNIDNTYVNLEYYNEKANRVKCIKEYGTNNTLGNTMSISYGDNVTKFTDNEGYSNNYTFNNFGQTISISDFGKNPEDTDNAYGKMYKYGEGQKNKNRLVLEGQLINIGNLENNLLENPKFNNNTNNWIGYQMENGDGVVNGTLKIKGNSDLNKNMHQTKNISGAKGDIYTFGCWVKTNGVPNSDDKVKNVNITIDICRADDTIQSVEKQINTDGSSWQFVWDQFITDSDYKWIRIHLVNNKNANETYFDNIGLFKENFGQSYTYDENGNIISTKDNAKNEEEFKYDSNNKLIATINPKGGKFTYEYDNSNPEKLISASNSLGNKYSFEYDEKGNMTNAKFEESSGQNIGIEYETHIAYKGWLGVVNNGDITGSEDFTNRMEAIKINLITDIPNAYVKYKAHLQNIGWQDYVQDGSIAGTTGESLRMEAIRIKLVNVPNYSVKYRTYVEKIGWQDWVKDDEISGTAGQGKAIYAIQIKLEYNKQDKKYIETKAEYSSDGNYQTAIIDQMGKTTQYQYNQTTGTVSKIIDANNKETNFTYNNLDFLTGVSKTVGNTTYSNSYSYENDRLKTITHNGFGYSFVYDDYGNVIQTKVGNQTLITNTYAANNGNLTSQKYGNNQTISYNYDRFNRLTKITGTNGNYQYTYDGKSNIHTIEDNVNNNTETFTYDLANRLVSSTNTNGFTKEYGYDINSNVNSSKYKLNSTTNTVTYNYDNANRVLDVKLNNSITWKNNMDNLSRITSKKITSGSNNYTTNYTYVDVPNVTNKTTTLLKSIQNGNNTVINYTYDNLGNIETIKNGNTLKNKYYYDALNQLIREDNVTQNKTITYTYDAGGNILNKKEYTYTTSSTLPTTPIKTITYAYGNTNWKDQLTNYNGKAITYDTIGNLLTYDGNTYTWQNGRKLTTITNTAQNKQISYKYNDNGIRISKTVNGTTTNYYLDGTKVIYEKTGNNVIYYTYDENGNLLGLKYNGEQYYYIKNGQNDIIGILNSSLAQVVSYEYDSWGNILNIKDANGNNITDSSNIGLINPYRYRSYRYDTETGMYYLQSRYYNPEWGRFINFDNYGGKIGELLSHNGYAYCQNNPVNMMDENGNWSIFATLVTVVFVAVIIYAITTMPVNTDTSVVQGITDVIKDVAENISSTVKNITKTKTQTQVKTDTATKTKNKDNDDIKIYRYNGQNPSNLTPKMKDINTGLSFSTVPAPGAAETTIGRINSTGVVYAVRDGLTHVSVRPVGVGMQLWIMAGPESIWTKAVKSSIIGKVK